MNCKWGPFCGDGTRSAEECDNGVRNNQPSMHEERLHDRLHLGALLRNGLIDAANEEQCDAGAGNGAGVRRELPLQAQ
jgi:hypothetical protein